MVPLGIEEGDERVGTIRLELGGLGRGKPANVPSVLDDGYLEPQADAEERQPVLPGPANRLDHPFDTANSEAAGHQQAVHPAEKLARGLLVGEEIARYPLELHPGVVGDAAMDQR